MGFPTRACMELTSDDAMKQSLRLVRDVSLSMSWNAESLPAEGERGDASIEVSIRWQGRHSKAHPDLKSSYIRALGNYNY